MATKRYVGNDSTNANAYDRANNWAQLSIRDSSWQWTASGSGTDEYYLEASGGGDPGIGEPGNVQENGTDLTAGTAGSLSASEWDWADNDTLGFSTVYVRLSDGADPDSKSKDFVTYTQIPQASDDVILPADAVKITAGLKQSGTSLSSFTVEEGHNADIGGSIRAPLEITTSSFDYNGSGSFAAIDLASSSVSPMIRNTGTPASGKRALYLNGDAMSTLNILTGNVGIGFIVGGTATEVDNINVSYIDSAQGDVDLKIASGVTDTSAGDITSLEQNGGVVQSEANITTVNIYSNGSYTQKAGNWTTANIYDGKAYPDATGTYATTNVKRGGSLLNTRDFQSKTLTDVEVENGGALKDPGRNITFTNAVEFPTGLTDCDLDFGRSVKLAVSAI